MSLFLSPPAKERGYTLQDNLWFFPQEHGEDMRKWDRKPTSSLATWLHELKRGTMTTRSSSRVNAALIDKMSLIDKTPDGKGMMI